MHAAHEMQGWPPALPSLVIEQEHPLALLTYLLTYLLTCLLTYQPSRVDSLVIEQERPLHAYHAPLGGSLVDMKPLKWMAGLPGTIDLRRSKDCCPIE